MISRGVALFLGALCCVASVACVGSTGSDLVTFTGAVHGPEVDATGAYSFSTPRGYDVTLTKAKMHVGAVYLNRSVPQVGIQETSCVLPGIYVGEITTGVDVDLLSGKPTEFPVSGDGTADRARVAEIWLNGGDINAEEDTTYVLVVAGTAKRGAEEIPFEGALTIGSNRKQAAENPANPGSHPICRERIVSPIAVDLTPSQGGALILDVDPAGWFSNVDFAELVTQGAEPPFQFKDNADGQASINLYRGLHDVSSTYRFRWLP